MGAKRGIKIAEFLSIWSGMLILPALALQSRYEIPFIFTALSMLALCIWAWEMPKLPMRDKSIEWAEQNEEDDEDFYLPARKQAEHEAEIAAAVFNQAQELSLFLAFICSMLIWEMSHGILYSILALCAAYFAATFMARKNREAALLKIHPDRRWIYEVTPL